MAIDSPLLQERRLMAFKIETTTGTAISLGDSDGTTPVIISGPPIQPDIEFNERQSFGASLSPIKGTMGPHGCSINFTTEVMGLGSSGVPAWSTLLAAAGMTNSVGTYSTPSPPDSTTLTVGSYEDGWQFLAAGCKFNGVMKGAAGKVVTVDWSGRGCWQAPSAVALLDPTYTTVIPPVLESATFTIGGTTYRISDFELDIGAAVSMRQDITAATGYRSGWTTNRRPIFRCSPERVAAGTKNWFTDMTSLTTAALNLVIGASANNIITIAAPAMQLISVQGGERDGLAVDTLEFQLIRSVNDGNDELTVAFS
jgi:hypothetical protein